MGSLIYLLGGPNSVISGVFGGFEKSERLKIRTGIQGLALLQSRSIPQFQGTDHTLTILDKSLSLLLLLGWVSIKGHIMFISSLMSKILR